MQPGLVEAVLEREDGGLDYGGGSAYKKQELIQELSTQCGQRSL